MSIVSCGYKASPKSNAEEDFHLFTANLDLLRANEKTILECAEYFFCDIPFSYCSWPYVDGDGLLCLGYLLLGWRDELLVEPCPDCAGNCLVTSFAGSPLSGGNSWTGFCSHCNKKHRKNNSARMPFVERLRFIVNLRKHYPHTITRLEEYDAMKFTFAGNGLEPAKKVRPVTIDLYQPVPLAELIEELRKGTIRPKNLPKAK